MHTLFKFLCKTHAYTKGFIIAIYRAKLISKLLTNSSIQICKDTVSMEVFVKADYMWHD